MLHLSPVRRKWRESVSLGRFQNCNSLKMDNFRHHGVEDESGGGTVSIVNNDGSTVAADIMDLMANMHWRWKARGIGMRPRFGRRYRRRLMPSAVGKANERLRTRDRVTDSSSRHGQRSGLDNDSAHAAGAQGTKRRGEAQGFRTADTRTDSRTAGPEKPIVTYTMFSLGKRPEIPIHGGPSL